MTLAVTDTQALIWYASGTPRRLGRLARTMFERAERGQATIYVPVLVLVELAEAMRRGVVGCDEGFTRWSGRLFASSHYVAVDLTTAIVREAEGLYAIPERGDRLIAATAAHLGCALLTNDPVLSRVPALRTIW
jgi:PIN domain nuclease of toxin-antitoxin system